MPTLGYIKIEDFLSSVKGNIIGQVVTDAKFRTFKEQYQWVKLMDGNIKIQRANGTGDVIVVPPVIPLDESLISFFGLYSGDGAKGSEDRKNPGVIKPAISFSQREPNLVRFAFKQFKKLFGNAIRFTFSLGEDSAFFMAGDGYKLLQSYYGGTVQLAQNLHQVRPNLSKADKRFLAEKRNVDGSNEEHLAFYYTHKAAMEEILTEVKKVAIESSGISLGRKDKITASLRRPFKKGARAPGGSSRSDEMHVGGLNGFGELFLKILYELEDSVINDNQISTQGLIEWNDIPSQVGEVVNVKDFFENHPYGDLNGDRPKIEEQAAYYVGRWPRSKEISLKKRLRIDPLLCYASGLYLAEGSTPKFALFDMYSAKVSGLSFGFTSSEDFSLRVTLGALKKLFKDEDCLSTWKVKVGSQYFPELVVSGLKQGVPMLRGGSSGDGKLRTMEISLSIKPWALDVAPSLVPYEDKFSHVEPTGAGLARIDFSASSALCKWFFPFIMYATFGSIVKAPKTEFINA